MKQAVRAPNAPAALAALILVWARGGAAEKKDSVVQTAQRTVSRFRDRGPGGEPGVGEPATPADGTEMPQAVAVAVGATALVLFLFILAGRRRKRSRRPRP